MMGEEQRRAFERALVEVCGENCYGMKLDSYDAMLIFQWACNWKDEQSSKVEPAQKKLIGWRMENYLYETDDPEQAKNWFGNVEVLPIFEGDINTSLPKPPKAVPDCPFNPSECAVYCKCDDQESWDE